MIATTVTCADGLTFTWAHSTRQEAAFALCSLLTELTEKKPYIRYMVSVSSVSWRAVEEPAPRATLPPLEDRSGQGRRATPPPDASSSPFDNDYRPQNTVYKSSPNREHY